MNSENCGRNSTPCTQQQKAINLINELVNQSIKSKLIIDINHEVKYSNCTITFAKSKDDLKKITKSFELPDKLNKFFKYKMYNLRSDYIKKEYNVTTKEDVKKVLEDNFKDIMFKLNDSKSTLKLEANDIDDYTLTFDNTVLGSIEYITGNLETKEKLPPDTISEIDSFEIKCYEGNKYSGWVKVTDDIFTEYSINSKLAKFLNDYIEIDDDHFNYYDGNEYKPIDKLSVRTSTLDSFLNNDGQVIEFVKYTVIVRIGNEDFYCYINDDTTFSYKELDDKTLIIVKYHVEVNDKGEPRVLLFDLKSKQFYNITSKIRSEPFSNMIALDDDIKSGDYYQRIHLSSKPNEDFRIIMTIKDKKLNGLKLQSLKGKQGYTFLSPLKLKGTNDNVKIEVDMSIPDDEEY